MAVRDLLGLCIFTKTRFGGKIQIRKGSYSLPRWWAREASNPRPPGYEPGALPTELRARNHSSLYSEPLFVSRAMRTVITLETKTLKPDPIQRLMKHYPRIVVIKAALMILQSGQKMNEENIERALKQILNDDEEESRD